LEAEEEASGQKIYLLEKITETLEDLEVVPAIQSEQQPTAATQILDKALEVEISQITVPLSGWVQVVVVLVE
jgi:hypothetical protein